MLYNNACEYITTNQRRKSDPVWAGQSTASGEQVYYGKDVYREIYCSFQVWQLKYAIQM